MFVMKLPTHGPTWLGLALLAGIVLMGVGGIIAALKGTGPSDGTITAITSMLSAIIGGLVGYTAGRGSNLP